MIKRSKKTLGEMLVEQGLIGAEALAKAQKGAKEGESLRKILIDLGLISEEDMVNFIAQHLEVPRIELKNCLIDPKIIDLVPEKLARKYLLIPVLKIGKSLTCAMVDVFNIYALDELTHQTGFSIEPAIATESEIRRALDEHYTIKGDLKEVIQSLDEMKMPQEKNLQAHVLKDLSQEPPVVKLVNLLLIQAVQQGASDIHIEPEENSLNVRFRIDGMLHQQENPPKHFQSAIISRVKILTNMDIAERRRPQDGRHQISKDGHQIDIRASCVPTIHGENIVLRLLDTSHGLLDLDQMGFNPALKEKYLKQLQAPNGIMLVTGPTGSGKTTTLYASLKSLNSVEKNIITIEDPVEYRLPGVRQIQVNPEIDLTFANGLRSILRQDPDIIMVGEIRDFETAQIAIHAALTGHLVLATLHTNSAAGAIARLMDMGIEPYLISSSLVGVMAQRLVRLLCKDCQGKGCHNCYQKGYKGRMGIFELMVFNEELRRLTARKASADEIEKTACHFGMSLLRQNGMEKAEQGLTSKEEVMRVTQEASQK